MKQLLDGKEIDSNWFVKEASKDSLSIEHKDKIKKLIDQSKEVSFEAILKKIENDLKRELNDGIIRILERFRKNAVTTSENLINAIKRDKFLLRLFWLILRTREEVINEIKRVIESKRDLVMWCIYSFIHDFS